MNIIIAPDSYKGSLTALEVGIIIEKAFKKVIPDVKCEVIPMADGGEGTLDALLFSPNSKRIQTNVTGPLEEKVTVEYGVLDDGKTAVIEIAKIAGLPMVPDDKRNPLYTTTYGIGEVIIECIESGYKDFVIGLGGSATNDGGLGMLQALGVTFLDSKGDSVVPSGVGLTQVKQIDFSTMHPLLKECNFKIASDVENPLCGEKGASAVFGPQKGATPTIIRELDQALAQYALLMEKELNKSYRFTKGAGAAGGLGFAFLILGAEITSGAQLIAKAIGLVNRLKNADWIITGEGQSDFQTLFGKVPGYIGKAANSNHVKAMLLSGSLGKGYEELYQYFVSCDSIVTGPMSLQECMEQAEDLLYKKAFNVARLVKELR